MAAYSENRASNCTSPRDVSHRAQLPEQTPFECNLHTKVVRLRLRSQIPLQQNHPSYRSMLARVRCTLKMTLAHDCRLAHDAAEAEPITPCQTVSEVVSCSVWNHNVILGLTALGAHWKICMCRWRALIRARSGYPG